MQKHCYVNAFNKQVLFRIFFSLRGSGNISEKSVGSWTCTTVSLKHDWTHFRSQFLKPKEGGEKNSYQYTSLNNFQGKTRIRVDLSPLDFYLCEHLQKNNVFSSTWQQTFHKRIVYTCPAFRNSPRIFEGALDTLIHVLDTFSICCEF